MSSDDSYGQQPSNYIPGPQQPEFPNPQQSTPQQHGAPDEPTQQYFRPLRHQYEHYVSPQAQPSLQQFFPGDGGPAYVPPWKPRRVGRDAYLIMLSAVGALIVIIAVVAGLTAIKTPVAGKPAAPPVVTAPSSAPAVQNATSVPAPSLSLTELEEQWAAGPAGTAGATVAADLKSSEGEVADVKAGDYGPVVATCQQLETDTTTALNAPANPDPNVAQHLSAAYAELQSAASSCVTGVQTLDASVIEEAEQELALARTQFADAIAGIEADCPGCMLSGQLS